MGPAYLLHTKLTLSLLVFSPAGVSFSFEALKGFCVLSRFKCSWAVKKRVSSFSCGWPKSGRGSSNGLALKGVNQRNSGRHFRPAIVSLFRPWGRPCAATHIISFNPYATSKRRYEYHHFPDAEVGYLRLSNQARISGVACLVSQLVCSCMSP